MNKTDATTGRLVVVGECGVNRDKGPSGFLCVDAHARGSLVDYGGPYGNARGQLVSEVESGDCWGSRGLNCLLGREDRETTSRGGIGGAQRGTLTHGGLRDRRQGDGPGGFFCAVWQLGNSDELLHWSLAVWHCPTTD